MTKICVMKWLPIVGFDSVAHKCSRGRLLSLFVQSRDHHSTDLIHCYSDGACHYIKTKQNKTPASVLLCVIDTFALDVSYFRDTLMYVCFCGFFFFEASWESYRSQGLITLIKICCVQNLDHKPLQRPLLTISPHLLHQKPIPPYHC